MAKNETFWIVEAITNQTQSFHLTKYNWIAEFPDQTTAEMNLETKYNAGFAQRKRDEILASLEEDTYDEFTDPSQLKTDKPLGKISVEYDVIATPEDQVWNNAYAAQHFRHHWTN